MKRIGGLVEQICDRANLVHAVWRAARGKHDRQEVRSFLRQGDEAINSLSRQLSTGRFRFQPYRQFTVRDTKRRTIHAPSFRDRVVHHAIISITGPVFESGAIFHSYACRAGKGHHAAVRQARKWTRRNGWYGKIDIRKFYDSVHHERLRQLLHRRFAEQRLLAIFDALLGSYQASPCRGLPIGALTADFREG